MKAKSRVVYTFSVKFIPKEGRYFWALFDAAGMAEGYCLDCGFTTNAVDAIAAARAFLGARPGTLGLVHGSLANAFYGCHWLGFAYVDFGQSLPEDRAYDIECSHQWDPPPVPPDAEEVRGRVPPRPRSQARRKAAGASPEVATSGHRTPSEGSRSSCLLGCEALEAAPFSGYVRWEG